MRAQARRHLRLATPPELRDSLAEARSRVLAHDGVHRSLSDARTSGVVEIGQYLNQVCTDLRTSAAKDHLLEVEADAIELPVDTAIGLGLITTELIMNAVKHAFADGQCGTIQAGFRDRERGFDLEVSDYGRGLPDTFDPPVPSGLGTQIVAMLAQRLNGTVKVERPDAETSFVVHIAPDRAADKETPRGS